MKQFSLVLAMFFFALGSLLAQKTITGTVTDEGGEPLIGANVIVKGTTTGASTDFDGKYSIQAKEGDVLEISYTGYTTKDVVVTGNVVDAFLSEGVTIDEVVISATGLKRNSRDVVYANQTVKAAELLTQPNKNALEALRGKVAGVKISTGSGSVGASTRIVLRAEGSLTGNNNPLIVIDGVPIDNSASSGGDGTAANGYSDYGSRFNDINPDDIASVTVLKGPSATSLYGSRGASGVLVITTKKGGDGKDGKVEFGFNTAASIQKAYVLTQRQSKFGQGYSGNHLDSGENFSWGPEVDGVVRPWTSAIDVDGDGQLEALQRPYSAVPNQLQSFFNIGNTFNNSFYLSGSKSGFSYYASYANVLQNGILENTKYKRNSFTFNASADLTKKLKTDFGITYAFVDQNTAQEGARAFEGNNPYAQVLQMPITIPVNELRDYKNPFHDTEKGYWGSYNSVNPYYILNEYGAEGVFNNLTGKMSLTYELAPGLSLVGRVGANIVNRSIEEWKPIYTPIEQIVWSDNLSLVTRTTRDASPGQYDFLNGKTTNIDATALANYTRKLDEAGDFSLNATVGTNLFDRRGRTLAGETVGGLVVPGWYHLRNSVQAPKSDQASSKYRLVGVYGNASVGYKNALFLEASARNDWSSTLPEASNSFLYWSLGTSAVLSEFLKLDKNTVNFWKVRASYGTTGKDAPLYSLYSTFAGNPTIVALANNHEIFFPLGGQPAFTQGNFIGNPNLKPELTATFEVGTDIGLFNDRVNLGYTYYSSTHKEQIVSVNLPASTGFTSTVVNIGEMTNKGHELSLNLKPIEGLVQGLTWDVNLQYAKNKNNVVKIADDIDELSITSSLGVSLVAAVGKPFGTFKALAPKTNAAGQTIVDARGFPLYTEEEQYFNSYQPDYTASIGTTLGYKGLSFNILFDVKKGGQFISNTKFYSEFNGTSMTSLLGDRQPFVYENSVVQNADGTFAANTNEIEAEEYFTNYDPAASTYIVDASYVKLREIGLTYALPKSLLKGMPIKGAKISFFANNVKFWLPAENTFADPEVNGPDQTGNGAGIETTQVPPSKSFGLSLGLTF